MEIGGNTVFVVARGQRSHDDFSSSLAGAGFPTRRFERGEEALQAVGIEPPALVLLEVELVGISGFEVCRRLRDELGERWRSS
jgi:DNA-binding response OmpR family regulator